MRQSPCVVSVAEHTGWAHVVCVAARNRVPEVVERRRVALIDPGLPTQPYEHDSRALREDDAEALLARVKRSVAACTSLALERVVTELAPSCKVVALAIRKPPFEALPKTVGEVWASHRWLSCADGMLYQLAVCRAARQLDLDVQMYKRGDESRWAAEPLGVGADEIDEFVSRTGRPPGPPWTQDHRQAYAAGIAVLAAHTRGRLALHAT